jgi:uncharacterized protein YutD
LVVMKQNQPSVRIKYEYMIGVWGHWPGRDRCYYDGSNIAAVSATRRTLVDLIRFI